ncbi:MAG: hypothetical protein LBJ44_05895 [Propionibacteriaceae bacterium]|jgi:hypothetical protein|nr:hypothetical protein [Propionibacteriaceae bacterium]
MIGSLRSEWRKTVSTRLWWTLAAAGYLGLTTAGLAATFRLGGQSLTGGGLPDVANGDLARLTYAVGPSLGYVFPAILGALTVTTEFRHQTITPTLLAEPRRARVLIAKLITVLPLSGAFGVLLTVVGVGLGAATWALLGQPTGLDQAATWSLIGRSVVAFALWGVFGVGLGLLIHNQVGAIVTLLGFTQLLEPVVRLVPVLSGHSWAGLDFLPGALSEAITGASLYSGFAPGVGPTLDWPLATVCLIGYGLVFAIVGGCTSWRRDVT